MSESVVVVQDPLEEAFGEECVSGWFRRLGKDAQSTYRSLFRVWLLWLWTQPDRGVTVSKDKSHPDRLEFIFYAPTGLQAFTEVQAQFAKQLALHLDVVQGIREGNQALLNLLKSGRVRRQYFNAGR